MPRTARLVVPGLPHHVTQRGNRRQQVFFRAEDYQLYRRLFSEACSSAGVAVLAYCLMPNHVHHILVPPSEGSLAGAIKAAHQKYTWAINRRERWSGYLWQGRFASAPMDGQHLLEAARYIELNPVRARLAVTPEAWTWSSAGAHLSGRTDGLADPKPLLDLVPDWRAFLAAAMEADQFRCEIEKSEQALRAGWPQGSAAFVSNLERRTGRLLKPQKPGRKPRPEVQDP